MEKVKKFIKIVCLAFLLTFVMQIVALPIGFLIGIFSGATGISETDYVGDKLITVFELIGEVTLPMFMLWYYRKNKKELQIVMPFKKDNVLKRYCLGFLGGFICFLIIWGIGVVAGGFTVRNIWQGNHLMWLILFLVGYGFQGMAEEILCRGYLQGRLTEAFNPVFAIVASSMVFAFLHSANPGVTGTALVSLFLFGLVMAVIRYYHNDLWFVGAFHSAWNFVQGPVLGVLVSGTPSQGMIFSSTPVAHHNWANGGSFGSEGSLSCLFVNLLLLILVLLWETKISKTRGKHFAV